jgi:hypothetical protein
MKKIVRNIGCALLLTVGLNSCQSQLEDMYVDPDKTTNPTIEKLFAGMMDNNRVRPQYYEMRTIAFQHTGRYSQSVAGINDENAWRQTDAYIQAKWNDFYVPNNFTNIINENNGAGVMAQYATITKLYADMLANDETKGHARDVEVFTWAAKTIMLDQSAQMVDLFGDIPFYEAGSLNKTNQTTNAHFDEQEALYTDIISQLRDCVIYFNSASLNSTASAAFAVQDYLNHGSLDKWSRYANSLRLRLLMRISFKNPDAARAGVQEMLSNNLQFKFIDGNGIGDNYNPSNTDVLLHQTTNYTDQLNGAFDEIKAWRAPDFMLNSVMKPSNDPRIPFMFDKYGRVINGVFVQNSDYNAMPVDMPSATQGSSDGDYAMIDSTTFRFNSKIPGVVMGASEVNFLLAEAIERWGLTGSGVRTAQQYYELGVRQAIAYLYYQYNLNPTKLEALTQPSTAQVDAFLANAAIAYTGTSQEKLGKIWTQKWLSFGFLQANQAWAETRRTDYPQFPKNYVAANPGYEAPPTRFRYPSSELAYNSAYLEVAAKDTRDTKIFWDVPQPN